MYGIASHTNMNKLLSNNTCLPFSSFFPGWPAQFLGSSLQGPDWERHLRVVWPGSPSHFCAESGESGTHLRLIVVKLSEANTRQVEWEAAKGQRVAKAALFARLWQAAPILCGCSYRADAFETVTAHKEIVFAHVKHWSWHCLLARKLLVVGSGDSALSAELASEKETIECALFSLQRICQVQGCIFCFFSRFPVFFQALVQKWEAGFFDHLWSIEQLECCERVGLALSRWSA